MPRILSADPDRKIHAMSIVAAARLSRAPIASLSAIGLIWGTLAASMPDIKAHVGANRSGVAPHVFWALALSSW